MTNVEKKLAFQLGAGLATNVLTSAKYVKGGYIIVSTLAELNKLTVETEDSDGVVVDGTPVYVSSEAKTYRYDAKNKTWKVDAADTAGKSGLKLMGTVSTIDELPKNAQFGDVYYVTATKLTYYKDSTDWKVLAGSIPTKTSDLTNDGIGEFDTHSQLPHKFITDKELSEAITAIIDGAPEAFDTLKEISDWIGTDESGAQSIISQVANKADKVEAAAGTYTKLTINSDGIVTGGTNPTTLAGYGITDVSIDTAKKSITVGDKTLTVLAEHPKITLKTDSASTVNDATSFTVVSDIEVDDNGHVVKKTKTTVNIPKPVYDSNTKTLIIK